MSQSNRRTLGLLLIVACAPSIGSLAALWIWPGTLGSSVYATCKIILYGAPAVVAFRTLGRAEVLAGARRGFKAKSVVYGIVSGGLIGGLILGLWFWFLSAHTDVSRLVEVVRESGLDGPMKYWLFAAWLSIGNSFLEEFVFRWFIDSRLRLLGLGAAVALPLSAAIFTLHHVIVLSAYFDPTIVLLGSAGVFTGGLLWSFTLMRWGSLVPGWICHVLVDVAIFIVGASVLGL